MLSMSAVFQSRILSSPQKHCVHWASFALGSSPVWKPSKTQEHTHEMCSTDLFYRPKVWKEQRHQQEENPGTTALLTWASPRPEAGQSPAHRCVSIPLLQGAVTDGLSLHPCSGPCGWQQLLVATKLLKVAESCIIISKASGTVQVPNKHQ